MLRLLRIAFSVVCGIACLLVAALWVRSYVYTDRLMGPLCWPSSFSIASDRGRIRVYLYGDRRDVRGGEWYSDSATPAGSGWERGPLWEFTQLSFGGWTVVVPHWLPAVMAAMFAGIPWLKWHFSLRTLLIAMTLIALTLGVIVWAAT